MCDGLDLEILMMKAVFLDRATFVESLPLMAPEGVSEYVVFENTPNDNLLIIERCQDADIIITNKVMIDRAVIEQLPKLKLIQLTATGTNNVDKAACEEYGVVLYNVAGYSVNSVPEHTFMLMLSVMRAARYYHHQVTNGAWQSDGKFCLLDMPILDLAGRTLGIIGKGVIGQRVGQIANAFGMKVLYAEHQGRAPRDNSYTTFDEVLERSDVLSLHCPLNNETHHLINKHTLAKMQCCPLIINVARGAVVDSRAIVDGIHAGQILGYATDVFEKEPPADDESLLTLKDHPRVLLTPHNAWGSLQSQQRLWQILTEQVATFISSYPKN